MRSDEVPVDVVRPFRANVSASVVFAVGVLSVGVLCVCICVAYANLFRILLMLTSYVRPPPVLRPAFEHNWPINAWHIRGI